MSHQSLPHAWVDRLFAKFTATFGAQKVGAMFPPETHDEVRSLWAEQLARFEPDTLRAAFQATIDSGHEWPPSLAEFVASCQRSAVERRQHAPAVLLQMPRSSPEVANRHVKAAASALASKKPSREWASRLLARHEAGEHFSISVLNMARAGARDEAEA